MTGCVMKFLPKRAHFDPLKRFLDHPAVMHDKKARRASFISELRKQWF